VISRSRRILLTALLVSALAAAQTTNQADPKPAPAAGQQPAQPGQDSSSAAKSPAASDSSAEDAVQQPKPPLQPKTELVDTSATAGALATDGHDPILDPPPYPKGITTLVGGVISSVDRIRNHLTVAVFGDGHWTVYFDERTHIFRNGAETTVLSLKKGERVYVDTMLDNNKRDIFARNIRVGLVTLPADAEGQIVEVDAARGRLMLRDSINSGDVRFSVDPNTLISQGTTPVPLANLRAGSLIHVKFSPDRASRAVAREIAILAAPGSVFTFAGTIAFLDTHRGVLAVRNAADGRSYDIHFVPARIASAAQLAVGAEVRVITAFDSSGYTAQQITVTRMAGAETK
jgi:hypothetical protein